MKRLKIMAVVLIAALLFIGCGYFFGQARLSKANKVLDLLQGGCIYTPDSDILVDGAAKGLTESIDDVYTQYLDHDHMQQLNNMVTATEKPGFGMEVVGISQGMKVVDVGPLSPAELAGLAPGDIIVEIDGKVPYTTQSFEGFSDGDRVSLTVMRGSGRHQCSVHIKPTPALPDVVARDLDGIRYIRVRSFMQHEVEQSFFEALQGAEKGYIIDLRNNPGGRLEAGLAIAELFIPEGAEVLGFEYKNGSDHYNSGNGNLAGANMCLLVDGYSASAAEIVAGSLKHYGYKVIGETTYGKGLVQSVEKFDDGTGLKYTSAEYLLPGGEHINGKGVLPDIPCQNVELFGDAPGWGLDYVDDIQLQQAVNVILNGMPK